MRLPALIVALDTPTLDDALKLATRLGDVPDAVKVGLELFVAEGPHAMHALAKETRLPIFLDLKLHDIPETVERAVAQAAALGASLLTVHAQGGAAMLERAVRCAQKEGDLTIVAVTVLTSLDAVDLEACGVTRSPDQQALRLAQMAQSVGVSAFVCSPNEVRLLREGLGSSPLLITPGVRPRGVSVDDQKRTDTPEGAVARGASAVVVGRPIRDAEDPRKAAEVIAHAIRSPSRSTGLPAGQGE
jgi:orotidine-5'-phosphate decarboxylase